MFIRTAAHVYTYSRAQVFICIAVPMSTCIAAHFYHLCLRTHDGSARDNISRNEKSSLELGAADCNPLYQRSNSPCLGIADGMPNAWMCPIALYFDGSEWCSGGRPPCRYTGAILMSVHSCLYTRTHDAGHRNVAAPFTSFARDGKLHLVQVRTHARTHGCAAKYALATAHS